MANVDCGYLSLIAGDVLTPDEYLKNQMITMQDGQITRVEPFTGTVNSPNVVDARDSLVIPGLIDLQVNGALGYSWQASDRDHYGAIAEFHRRAGTTTLLPTLVTADEQTLLDSLATLADTIAAPQRVTLAGIHLEGPFLALDKSGAHDQTALRRPDLALAQRFHAAARGHLSIVTLAPELPGSLPVIEFLAEQAVVVAAGHSAASWEEMRQAADAGLRFITHAGNASDWPHRALGAQGFMTSEPGVVGALMTDKRLGAGIILDGYHFHPSLLLPLIQLRGAENLVLVSDASTVAGCPPGDYESGGLQVTIHPQGFATSGRGGGWLAGSLITLSDAVRLAVDLAGIPLQTAVRMATSSPAQWIGLKHKGRIAPGMDADLLVLDHNLNCRQVISAGKLHFSS